MKEPKILSMSEYSMGLVDAAEGSKDFMGRRIKKNQKTGSGMIAAARGSKEFRDLMKRKIGRAKGGAVKKK